MFANTNRITMARSPGSRAGSPRKPIGSPLPFLVSNFFRIHPSKLLTMGWRKGLFFAVLFVLGAGATYAQSAYSVEIDLEEQTAYLIHGRQVVLATPIST